MNIAQKDIDINNAIITLSIEKTDYSDAVAKKVSEYRKKANIPGFRPGRVPANLIKKMYGKSILAEEINNLVGESLYKYIQDSNLNILGEPLPNQSEQQPVDFDNDEEFEFKFDIGIAPKIEVEVSDKDTIKWYDIDIDEKMIENQKDSYISRFGQYEQMDEAEPNDMLKGKLVELAEDGTPKKDGIEVLDAVLTVDVMKDEAQKVLFDKAKKEATIVFNPSKAYDNNEAELASLMKIDKAEVANATGEFSFTINGITRYIKAEVNQALFDKAFGEGVVKSEEEFTEKIKTAIKENLDMDSQYKFTLDVKTYYSDKFKEKTFPEAFLKRWLTEKDDKLSVEDVEKEYTPMIENLVWHLIVDSITRKGELKVEKEDIENYARKVANAQLAQYGMTGMGYDMLDGFVQEMMKDEKNVRNFIDRAAEEKAVNFVKENITLENVKISGDEFNKLVSPQA